MDKRFRVAEMAQKGFSARLIYAKMKKARVLVPLSTIGLWLQRLKANRNAFLTGPRRKHAGNVKANRKGAAPLSMRDRMRIREFVKKHPELRLRKSAKALPGGIKASYSTVRRESRKHGMVGKHKAKKPRLTKAQRAKRRQFAKDNLGF